MELTTPANPEPATPVPPIRPGPEPLEPRRVGIPTRALLPAGLRHRVAVFDARVDTGFDHFRGNPVADRVAYATSELADFSVGWLLIGTARGLRSEAEADAAFRLIGCLMAESVLVNGLIKTVFGRTRPEWDQSRPHRLRRPRSSSFPSGHASAAFCAAALLSDTGGRHRPTTPVWYGLAALVAASRVHVKIHHASDVLVGAALGAVLGRIALKAWPLHRNP